MLRGHGSGEARKGDPLRDRDSVFIRKDGTCFPVTCG